MNGCPDNMNGAVQPSPVRELEREHEPDLLLDRRMSWPGSSQPLFPSPLYQTTGRPVKQSFAYIDFVSGEVTADSSVLL